MSFFGMPSPSSPSPQEQSSRELLVVLNKIRKSIQKGALENRAKLVSGLGVLAVVFAREEKFNDALKAFDEALELADVLKDEGYPDLFEELGADAFPLMSTLREAERDNPDLKRFDRTAFYSRFEQCFSKFPQDKFEGVEVIWARENYEQARDLYGLSNARNPIITKLDALIEKLESNFNWNSDHFSAWDGLMNPFLLRSICKYEVGDRNEAIKDMKRYEELSAIADDILKTGQMKSKAQMENGKFVIRMNLDDMFDMIGYVNFRNNRFECMSRLAHMYAEKAEKENALEYYDKALEVATEERNNKFHSVDDFGVISAKAEMPARKGHLFLLFHEYEEALKYFDEAIQATESILETDDEDVLEEMESCFASYCRERSDVLRNLGRFDEATEAINNAKDDFSRIRREAAERFQEKMEAEEKEEEEAKQQRGDDEGINIEDIQDHLAEFFSSGAMLGNDPAPMPKKRSIAPPKEQPPAPPKKSAKDMDERDFMLHLGTKHNEAAMDTQRGMVELQRGRYRSALKYFHKARIVFDFIALREVFPEALKNAFMLYFQISVCYSDLGLNQDAEAWFKQTDMLAQKLIDSGHLEFRKERCQVLTALGSLYSHVGEWENAIQSLEKSIAIRTPLIEEFMDDIRGKDPQQVLRDDNQRIMRIAEVLEKNITTRATLVNALFQQGRIDDAIVQSRLNLESAEELRRILPDHQLTIQRYNSAAQQLGVLLRLTNQDAEAAKCLEMQVQCNLVHPRTPPEYLRAMFEKGCEIQLFDMIFDDLELHQQRKEYTKAINLYQQGEKDESLEIIADIREEIESHHLFENPHPLVEHLKNHLLQILDETAEKIRQGTWEDVKIGKNDDDDEDVDDEQTNIRIKNLDTDVHNMLYDRLKSVSNVDETDTEDYSLYERPADDKKVSMELMYQLFDEFGDKNTNMAEDYRKDAAARNKLLKRVQQMQQSQQTIEPVGSKPSVGRNDPCPCGSGKKYKKCCGK